MPDLDDHEARPLSAAAGQVPDRAGKLAPSRRSGMVSPTVFWPIPRVYSGLIRVDRYENPPWPTDEAVRRQVFELVDIAFAQRRKTARNAFAGWAGSGNESARRLLSASIDPARRGETLSIADFVRLLQRSAESEPATT